MAPLTDFPELLRLAATLLLDQPRQRRLHSADDVAAYGVEVRSPASDLLGELVRAAPDGPDVAHDTLIRGALAHGLLLLADSRMPRMREIGDLMLQFSTGVRILCREDNAELRAELLALHQRIDAELPADDPRRRSLQALRELVDGDPLLLARRELVAVLEDKADRLAPNISLVDLLRVAATVLREHKEVLSDTKRRLAETVESLGESFRQHNKTRDDEIAQVKRAVRAERELAEAKLRVADLELAATKRQATVDRQGNELGALRTERTRLIDRIAELDRERHALKTELDQTGRLRDAQREIEQSRVRQDVLTADRDMWRRRTERLQAWFALPPDQRHPLGPEFTAEPERAKPGGGAPTCGTSPLPSATMGDGFAPGSPMNSIPPEHPHFLTLPMTVLDASDPQAQEFMRIVDEAAAAVEHGAVISTGEELAAFLRQDAGAEDPARLVLDDGRLLVHMPTPPAQPLAPCKVCDRPTDDPDRFGRCPACWSSDLHFDPEHT